MTTMTTNTTAEVGIVELGELINRRPATIREWERQKLLPQKLLPRRDTRNRRLWTQEQAKGILAWMHKTKRYPGKGLKGYEPSAEETEQQISRMRKAA